MKQARNVDEYIKLAPGSVQPKLRELQNLIKSCAPKAIEKISYGMPYYGYKGRLAYFAFFKNHIGFYAMSGVLANFSEEVKQYQTGKATLRFSMNEKLPIVLLKKIVNATVEINEAK